MTVLGWASGQAGPFTWLGILAVVGMWAGVVAVAVWLLARATRTEHQPASLMVPPRGILDRRFLSGEIDAQTYARGRRILDGESIASGSTARR